MRRIRRFLRLSTTERQLLISAVLLLGAVKVGLVLLPFHKARRLLGMLSKEAPGLHRDDDRASLERVVWAVTLAGHIMPWASTCLTRALSAQVLLLRRGHPALLHIGAVRGEKGKFEAHAWVESGGDVVIGGYELEQYTPLAVLDGGAR